MYVPQIKGKEKRKKTPSKEGYLGVEGMERKLLFDLFAPFAGKKEFSCERPITKTDFYLDGMTGQAGSRLRRDEFAALFHLPAGMTPGALLAAVNIICTRKEYQAAVARLSKDKPEAGKEEL